MPQSGMHPRVDTKEFLGGVIAFPATNNLCSALCTTGVRRCKSIPRTLVRVQGLGLRF
jgi:hypothetical protein